MSKQLCYRSRSASICWRAGLALIALLVGQRNAVAADAPISREYQIKAAFLYNIPKFVEWPADGFTDANAPIVIGVLGVNPFGDVLQTIVRDRKINGRSVIVKQVESVAEARVSQLLFVGANEDARFAGMRKAMEGSTVLTVGESAAFAAAGGGIRFVPVGDKLSFEINMSSVERAHLKISSQLQKLAIAVSRTP